MKTLKGLKSILALASLGVVAALWQGTASAQTTANGPYYATPSWDQTLPSNTRFIVLSNMASQAVLDRETGLVWERSPSTSPFTWSNAHIHCIEQTTGGRMGWRLPTLQELLSLMDPSVPIFSIRLPSGHPFSNVQTGNYWSATSISGSDNGAWGLTFIGSSELGNRSFGRFAWCVRGGQGVDAQ